MIDLDAVLGESEPKPLRYKGQEFSLPGELPGSALSPFLNPNLGIPQLIADLINAEEQAEQGGDDEDAGWVSKLIDTLIAKPTLPVQLLDAARDALAALLGEQSEAFFALNPSVNAYAALAARIPTEYGTDLADFFFSAGSSDSDGEQPKPTSSASTTSTSEGSGDAQENPAP